MLKEVITKKVDVKINVIGCDICGTEIRQENDCEEIIDQSNEGCIDIKVSVNGICYYFNMGEICKDCSKQKINEFIETLKDIGFEVEKW